MCIYVSMFVHDYLKTKKSMGRRVPIVPVLRMGVGGHTRHVGVYNVASAIVLSDNFEMWRSCL